MNHNSKNDTAPDQVHMNAAIQQDYKILSEFKMIQSENVAGVYVIPSYKSSFLWFGVIFVRDGYYKDGIFRFTISLPDKFPDHHEVPSIIFESYIIHPLVCPYTNRLDTSEAFTAWNSANNHVWQLLKYVQFVFEHTDACFGGKVANVDAADRYRHRLPVYLAEIKECIRVGRDQLYDVPTTDDKHYITFDRYDKEVHGVTLETIRKGTDLTMSSQTSSGVSWLLGS